MKFDPNPLYYKMLKWYLANKGDDKLIICNEGSTRSSKTQDAFHLIETFCSYFVNKPLRIGVFRNTLKDCREKTYDDFRRYLSNEIRGIYDKECAMKENSSPEYFLHGSKIEFRGLDEETEQKSYDIVFINEALEIESETKISGLMIRCTKLFIADWNPKYTMHWIFNWEKRKNCLFTKTTYKNNKHLPKEIIRGIEEKSPWHLDDLHLPEHKRRPHPTNIENGTADKWYFTVYGMGERANKEGLVFPSVTWLEELDYNTDRIMYGLDFGNTTGTFAFSEVYTIGNKLFADCPIYGKFANSEEIGTNINSGLLNFYKVFKELVAKRKLTDVEMIIICDSANPDFIKNLNMWSQNDNLKCKFLPVKKFPGCIRARIDKLNRYDIHLVDRPHIRVEQENYAYKEIHGIPINEPEKKHDHFWDSLGYAFQYYDI